MLPPLAAPIRYTSEPDYWERVEQFVGSEPSTLRLMFPEVYLEKGHDEEVSPVGVPVAQMLCGRY